MIIWRFLYRFLRKIRIYGILGLIDGTIIRLRKPSEAEEAYLTRYGYHGLNCTIVIF